MLTMNLKIGNGIDIHQLKKGIPLILGGIKIKSKLGIEGHSDGDVLLHALVDALLGALALGDIGTFFPSNEKWKNCNSDFFLKEVLKKLKKQNYKISNIDSTIILQEPKINIYIPKIKENLKKLTSLQKNQISVKATTTDYLGFIGDSKGIVAVTSVLIYKDNK